MQQPSEGQFRFIELQTGPAIQRNRKPNQSETRAPE
jgi:hypothetical protein